MIVYMMKQNIQKNNKFMILQKKNKLSDVNLILIFKFLREWKLSTSITESMCSHYCTHSLIFLYARFSMYIKNILIILIFLHLLFWYSRWEMATTS